MWNSILSALGWLASAVMSWFGGRKGEEVRNAEEQKADAVRYIHGVENIDNVSAGDALDRMQKWND